MHYNFENIIDVVLKAGSVAGLISLFYTIKEHLKSRPKFSFDFMGSGGGVYEQDGIKFAKYRWEGIIKNESQSENSIVQISYVIWSNKRRTRQKTNGMIFDITDTNTKEKIGTPINFGPKESRKISVVTDIALTGTHNESLFFAQKPIKQGSPFLLPEYNWDLIFVDVNHNHFDEKGILRSQKLADLWWLLPNSTKSLEQGNPFPTISHFIKIALANMVYYSKRFFSLFGF